MIFYIPVIAAVLGNVLYHSAQRLTPGAANPFLAIGCSFGLASALLLGLYAFRGGGALAQDARALNWTSLGLGLSVAVIECSFLLAYRQGWPVGVVSLVVTAAQTALLIPLGRFAFGERLPAAAWAGVALCLAGLTLICLAPRRA